MNSAPRDIQIVSLEGRDVPGKRCIGVLGGSCRVSSRPAARRAGNVPDGRRRAVSAHAVVRVSHRLARSFSGRKARPTETLECTGVLPVVAQIVPAKAATPDSRPGRVTTAARGRSSPRMTPPRLSTQPARWSAPRCRRRNRFPTLSVLARLYSRARRTLAASNAARRPSSARPPSVPARTVRASSERARCAPWTAATTPTPDAPTLASKPARSAAADQSRRGRRRSRAEARRRARSRFGPVFLTASESADQLRRASRAFGVPPRDSPRCRFEGVPHSRP